MRIDARQNDRKQRIGRPIAQIDRHPVICGIDEAGRGPLAGPVCAAAVALRPDRPIAGLADSKRLSAHQRASAERVIRADALCWAIGWATPMEIDRMNILRATMLAMSRAFSLLPISHTDARHNEHPWQPDGIAPDDRAFIHRQDAMIHVWRAYGGDAQGYRVNWVLVDGNRLPDLPIGGAAIIGGDSKVPEIQAASILAKTARDRWMIAYDAIEPRYCFAGHKGYPTPAHRAAIAQYGMSNIQRRSFALSSKKKRRCPSDSDLSDTLSEEQSFTP